MLAYIKKESERLEYLNDFFNDLDFSNHIEFKFKSNDEFENKIKDYFNYSTKEEQEEFNFNIITNYLEVAREDINNMALSFIKKNGLIGINKNIFLFSSYNSNCLDLVWDIINFGYKFDEMSSNLYIEHFEKLIDGFSYSKEDLIQLYIYFKKRLCDIEKEKINNMLKEEEDDEKGSGKRRRRM